MIFCPLYSFSQVSQQWAKRYNGPAGSFDIARKLILKHDGSILVFGNSVGINTSADMTIIKYSPSGTEEWVTRYNYPANETDNIASADLDESGNIYVTGFITNESSLTRLALLKFDPNGSFLWIRTFDSTAYTQSYGESVSISPDGNIYVTGSARNLSSNYDYVTIKYDPAGQRVWLRTFNGSGNGDDNPIGVVAGDHGNVFVTGTSKSTSIGTDIITIKYDSTGSLQFLRSTNSNPNDDDRATSIALDQNNSIIITGVTIIPPNGFDYFTVKYDQSGNFIWEKTYNGPGNSIDYTYQVITDTEDNIYVTGSSRNGSALGTEDVLTIKYDSAGAVKWINRFDGQAEGSDIGYCIAVDSELNVYIGGAIDRGNVFLEIGTIKLNSSGDQEWFRAYTFHSAPEDFPYSIAVDELDNVYVLGITFGGSTDYDITTIKYSQSIGISQIGNSIPGKLALYQNFPNPFNPATRIKFDIPVSGHVSLKVYDITGKLVGILFDKYFSAGSYEYLFDASGLPSGVYFYSLYSNNERETSKMLLIR
jgi:hypothetical protein